MSIKARILEFIDYSGISKRQFYAKTGLANGTLDKGDNIGTDKLEKIYNTFPEINLVWLITGNGKMLQACETVKSLSPAKADVDKPSLPSFSELVDRITALELDVQLLKKKVFKSSN
jgi:hypothetical protein